MEKKIDSLAKAKWVVELLGYNLEGPDKNGDYDVLDHNQEYYVGYIRPRYGEYALSISYDDLYCVECGMDYGNWMCEIQIQSGEFKDYLIKIREDKNNNKRINVLDSNAVEYGFEIGIGITMGDKSFKIATDEDSTVKLDDNKYTIYEYDDANIDYTTEVVEKNIEPGVLHITKTVDEHKDRYYANEEDDIKEYTKQGTLDEYIKEDVVGKELITQFIDKLKGVTENLFTKDIIEIIGKEYISKSKLSLLFDEVIKEKKGNKVKVKKPKK